MSHITATINVSKLDKSAFFTGKNGTYCTLILFENAQADQYGNTFAIKH